LNSRRLMMWTLVTGMTNDRLLPGVLREAGDMSG
jgi:hypothetical protein